MAVTTAAAISQILCEGCEDGTAILFCCQCAHFICEECVKQHQRLKVFQGHRIVTLAQLGEEHAWRPPPTCAKHDDSPVTMFCRQCNALLCPKCAGHESHGVKAVDQYAPEVRKEVEEAVKRVADRAGELEKAGSEAKATVAAVEHQRDSLSQTITESFKAVHHLLREQEEVLKKEVELIAEGKIKVLHEQMERLCKVFKSMNGLISATNQKVKRASNGSLVGMSKRTLEELERSLNQCKQLHVTPDAVADINFSPPTVHLHQLGAVYCSNPSLVTQVPKIAMVSESSEVLLCVPESSENPSPGGIQVQLVSFAHPNKVASAAHSEEKDIYRAVFVPQVRGQHKLTINASKKRIGKEPFSVNYRLTDLDKPVWTFAGFNGPSAITLNPKGELVVVESKGKQLTLVERKSWKKLRTITCKEMSNPTGVAVTKDGTIFICQPHCLLRSNNNGDHWVIIGRQGKNPLEFDSPSSVKAIGDEVYVCDTGNGRVQVLNSNGQFLRAFFTSGINNPRDITAGEDGLYMADNNCIWLYNQEGALVRKTRITGGPELGGFIPYVSISSTHNICVDCNGNVFVTVHASCGGVGGVGGVYVIRPTGEYITRFGTCVAKPSGMVIDDDGFVFICGDGKVYVL